MSSDPFVGDIMHWPMAFPPRGWAFCDGSILEIKTHSSLFDVIGNKFGGDGRTTFALPDLRSRSPVGAGKGASLKPVKLGEAGGVETVILQTSTTPSHHHTIQCSSALGTREFPQGSYPASEDVPLLHVWSTSNANGTMHPDLVQGTGAGQLHENRSPYIGQNFVIALTGEFPRRN